VRSRTFLLEIVMIAVAVAFLFPVYALVTLSLKSPDQISQTPLSLPNPPTAANFTEAWSAAALGPSLMNSTLITVASLIALIALGSFAA
jgi:raffinose/stachyose/melibiose transport system permease protein